MVGDFRDRLMSGGLNSYSATVTEASLRSARRHPGGRPARRASGRQTNGHFCKFNVEYRRLQRITDQFNLLFAYAAQGANKNLTAAEKMALGGPNGVRAYPVGEAPGDVGQIGTLELRWLVPKLQVFGGDLTLSTFIDHGQVMTQKNPPSAVSAVSANKRSITGAGFGISLGREGNFLLRVDIATPLDNETPTSDVEEARSAGLGTVIKWF